jgi:hypothetical protein
MRGFQYVYHIPATKVAHAEEFDGTAPVPEDPPEALRVVQILLFSFIPVDISSAEPISDSQIVSVIQMSPAMQKCRSF